ncbi:hypothetical protein [Enterococcus sp. AZ173]|uniref:hypothetical protein n=1 Tax=Enterococcus sp. AZ173 TaxID=2774700 RepID=UPI003D29E473
MKLSNYQWLGTSAVLKLDTESKDELINILSLSDSDYDYGNGELEIYNNKHILFLEEQFIESTHLEFEDLLKKYVDKDYSNLKFFSKKKSSLFKMPKKIITDKQNYNSIIEGNNIVTDGIVENRILIPPSFFYELNKMYELHEEESRKPLNYLSELFSLFIIADKSKISIETEDTYFEFTIFCEKKDNHILKVSWKDWTYFTNDAFYKCYQWILDRSIESFKTSTLLKVVRQYFENVSNLKKVEDLTASLDSILNRIIINETKEYFEQQNKLKDELILYKKMEMEANNALMKSLLGLITTVGVAYYSKVILVKQFDFTSKNKGIAVIFIFALVAILFFTFVFTVNFIERKNYYDSLRNIYLNKFAFSKEDFESFLDKPALIKGKKIYWITLFIFTIVIISLIYLYI